MDEATLNILMRAVAAVAGAVLAYLAKVAAQYIKQRLTAAERANLDTFVAELVAAAEQTLRKDDPTGDLRLDYVQKMLVAAGYDLTEAIMALIESKVYEINLETRK